MRTTPSSCWPRCRIGPTSPSGAIARMRRTAIVPFCASCWLSTARSLRARGRGMDSYVAALLDSELPVGTWIVALVWLESVVGIQTVPGAARAESRRQSFIVVEQHPFVARGFTPRFVVVHVVMGCLLFLLVPSLSAL